MATLSVTSIAMAPATTSPIAMVTALSSSNGDKFLNTGREIVVFAATSSNAGVGLASVVTVAAQSVDNFGGLASLHNLTMTVSASSAFGLSAMGPFPPSVFNDTSGFVNMTYSVAGLNVAVFSVAPRS